MCSTDNLSVADVPENRSQKCDQRSNKPDEIWIIWRRINHRFSLISTNLAYLAGIHLDDLPNLTLGDVIDCGVVIPCHSIHRICPASSRAGSMSRMSGSRPTVLTLWLPTNNSSGIRS